jgi:CheY-like chemotaxis protein
MENVKRGDKLTQRLLSFSKQKTDAPEPTNLSNLVDQNNLTLQNVITTNIELHLKLSDDPWKILVDTSDLLDVILNITINASHSMPDGGSFTIQTQNLHFGEKDAQAINMLAGDYVQLLMSDTGTGMSEETLKHIFDPFYTTKGNKGTGLGMSQVYSFCERSNAHIRISSILGRGTQVAIYFPKILEDGFEEGPQQDESNVQLTGTESILVVDDEPALTQIASTILNQNGYTTTIANSGEEAIDILSQNKVDLVLSDVIMTGINGYQLSKYIKKNFPDTKVQLVSGFNEEKKVNPDDHDVQRSLLRKPYDSQQLLKRIRDNLDSA